MDQPRETTREITGVSRRRVSCDGAGGIRPAFGVPPAALGHPRVWLEIDEKGHVDCGYCDRRFVLEGAPDVAAMGDEGFGGGHAGH